MATLAALEKQINQLIKQREALLKGEAKEAAKKVRALVEKFGLTAQDVGLAAKPRKTTGKQPAKKAAGIPKYRDPASGKTWTGQGKPPGWIAGAEDRSAFLIAPVQASEVNGVASKGVATKVAKKAARAPAQTASPAGKTAKAVPPVRPALRKSPKPEPAKQTNNDSQAAPAGSEVPAS